MDEIEQLLEGGKAEAAAQKASEASPSNGRREGSYGEVSWIASAPDSAAPSG